MTLQNILPVDLQHMQRAIALALQAKGLTVPNPLVGAVVLDSEGKTVGDGFHPRAGEPHAEVFALNEAGERARGGTLYVTLEPCCHHGKTPPCLDRVLASGVARVVIGMQDPNPVVAGKSVNALRAAGIDTVIGIAQDECRELNQGFAKRMQTGLPWVALKLAVTLDGRIADHTGGSRWISGPQARAYVHQLRNFFDCVLVGPGTAVADDPELNVRDIPNGRDPVRAIFDPSLTVTAHARACNASDQFKFSLPQTLIFCRNERAVAEQANFPPHVELVGLSADAQNRCSERDAIEAIGRRGINSVLCEGGGKFAAALLEQQLVDEVHWIIAPKMLVDGASIPALNGRGSRLLANAVTLDAIEVEPLGQDVLVRGRVVYSS